MFYYYDYKSKLKNSAAASNLQKALYKKGIKDFYKKKGIKDFSLRRGRVDVAG